MPRISRRTLMGSIPATLTGAAFAGAARAGTDPGAPFVYEVTRSEDEWRDRLTEAEYTIMREGGTEPPKSHPLWDSTEAGMYCCKGCDLPIYDARWKVVLPAGWLFYRHSEPDAVLTSIDTSVYSEFGGRDAGMGPIKPDTPPPSELSDEELRALDSLLLIEVHCRRCASHLGHLILAGNRLVHCVNGTAMTFTPETA